MASKNRRLLATCVLAAALIGSLGTQISGASVVEEAAERIAGLHPARAGAVEQSVALLRHGEYAMALLRLSAEKPDASLQAQARILSAYALLVAGNTLGAFPERS